jgi:hypothetical protein
MQLQQEAGLTGYKNISINRKQLSIYSNLGPHIHGDGGNSKYRPPPPPPPRTTQDLQLLMHSFGVPTNGGRWNLSRTKGGVGEAAAAGSHDASNGSDVDGGGGRWSKWTL